MSKPRILVVEDEESIADTIRYVLSMDGLDPIWCPTATAALEVAAKSELALAALHIGLPALAPKISTLYFVAFVDRGNRLRIISLRRATRSEVKHYVDTI